LGTTIRLPTTPVPAREDHHAVLPAVVDALCLLIIARDEEDTIGDRVRAHAHRVDKVLVIDDGSVDHTRRAAEEAGARVFRLPSPRGQGVALRAGLRLARELGYIGALVPGADDLDHAAIDAFARAHLRAPEALIVGVGPGQALAGKEWKELADLAAGLEPEPYPEWRPPKAEGLPGLMEDAFTALVETRFGYPWGGPRLLPLQAVLRRDLREDGDAVHIELLGLAVYSGIPTVEIELERAPDRPVVTCRKAALRLLPRFWALTTGRRLRERLGMGGGYAPPTTSPLALALGAGLVAMLALGGCPRKGPVTQTSVCPDGLAASEWPGAGDATLARDQLLEQRAAVATVWIQQDVRIEDPEMGTRRLKGVRALDGDDRVRLRLLAPMGLTVIDYVQADGRWQLTVPPAGIHRQGTEGTSPMSEEEEAQGEMGLRPDQIVSLLRSIGPDAPVRWQPGACAVLEELDDATVVRRLGFGRIDLAVDGADPLATWVVASEEILDEDVVVAKTAYEDYRSVGEGMWPFHSEVSDPRRGSVVVLDAKAVRTDGVTDAFFAMTTD